MVFDVAELVVELLQEGLACAGSVQRDPLGQGNVGESRLPTPEEPLPGILRNLLVKPRLALAEERVVALAQEARVGAGQADRLPPAWVNRHAHVGGDIVVPLSHVRTDRAHAGRVSVARGDDIRERLVVAAERGKRVVASRLVVDASHDRDLVHPSSQAGKVLADLDTRDAGGGGFELAADLSRGVRLEVHHVLAGRSTHEEQNDNVLGPGRSSVRATASFRTQQVRQAKAAQGRHGPCLQALAPGDAVTATAWSAEHGQHGSLPITIGSQTSGDQTGGKGGATAEAHGAARHPSKRAASWSVPRGGSRLATAPVAYTVRRNRSESMVG